MAQYLKEVPNGAPDKCTYDSDGKKQCIHCHQYSALALSSGRATSSAATSIVAAAAKPSIEKKSNKKKRDSLEWSTELKNDPEVLSGCVTLYNDRIYVGCKDCGSTHKMLREYCGYNWNAKVNNDTYLGKKGARENTERRIMTGIEK